MKTKYCAKCDKTKSIKLFYYNKGVIASWCKECYADRYKNLTKQERADRFNRQKELQVIRLDEWSKIISDLYSVFNCQICGINLVFTSIGNGTNYATAVCFDHRFGDELIGNSYAPSVWLIHHVPNKKNIETFKRCDFGILCRTCNLMVGSPKNRSQRITNAYKYVTEKGKAGIL